MPNSKSRFLQPSQLSESAISASLKDRHIMQHSFNRRSHQRSHEEVQKDTSVKGETRQECRQRTNSNTCHNKRNNKQIKTPLNVVQPTYNVLRWKISAKYTQCTRRTRRHPQGPHECRNNRFGSHCYPTTIRDQATNSIAHSRHDQHRSPCIRGGQYRH